MSGVILKRDDGWMRGGCLRCSSIPHILFVSGGFFFLHVSFLVGYGWAWLRVGNKVKVDFKSCWFSIRCEVFGMWHILSLTARIEEDEWFVGHVDIIRIYSAHIYRIAQSASLTPLALIATLRISWCEFPPTASLPGVCTSVCSRLDLFHII